MLRVRGKGESKGTLLLYYCTSDFLLFKKMFKQPWCRMTLILFMWFPSPLYVSANFPEIFLATHWEAHTPIPQVYREGMVVDNQATWLKKTKLYGIFLYILKTLYERPHIKESSIEAYLHKIASIKNISSSPSLAGLS